MKNTSNSKSLGYTKTIAVALAAAIILIPVILKSLSKRQALIYWTIMFTLGIAFSAVVNSEYIVPAWQFTKTKIIGWQLLNVVFEDWIFYACSPIIFLVVFITSFNKTEFMPKWFPWALIVLNGVFTLESFVGLYISLFFFLPSIVLIFLNGFVYSWRPYAILLPLSTLWDWGATNFLDQWHYSHEIYKWFFLNSPLCITPWFSIIGITLAQQTFFLMKRKL